MHHRKHRLALGETSATHFKSLCAIWGLLIALLLSLPTSVAFANINYITDDNNNKPIQLQAYYFIDPQSSLSIDDIHLEKSQRQFKSIDSHTANFGFTDANLWIRITYQDQRKTPYDNDLVVEVANPLLDYIEIYRPGPAGLTAYQTGQLRGYEQREIDHPHFFLYLPKAISKPVTIYLKIKSATPLIIPMGIKSVHGGFAQGTLTSKSNHIFIGVFLLILFYNMLLAFTLNEPEQYYYTAWLFLVTLTSSIMGGVSQPYFGELGTWIAINLWGFGSLICTLFLLYLTTTLSLNSWQPTLHKIVVLLCIPFALNSLFIFVTDYRLWQWTILLCGLCGAICTLVFVWGIYLNQKASYLALIAFTPVLTGLFTFILASANILESNWWTFNSLFIGVTATAIAVSLTTGNKVNEEKKKRYLLEKKNRINLETNNALLTKSNAVKNAFLSTISHELRTPLNGAFSSLSLLEETIHQLAKENSLALPEDTQTYFDIIRDTNNEMINLINRIIGFSELHDQHTTVNVGYFSPYETIISLIDLRTDLITKKHIDVHVGIDSLQPIEIIIDNEKYKKVVGIIFDNAIKFTKKGSITILGSINKSDQEHTQLVISITDTGVGIPESKLETITEPFSQADQSYTREFGGLGIGLAVCKKTMELLDGEINITSTEGQGTCVQLLFEIPGFRTTPDVALTTAYLARPTVKSSANKCAPGTSTDLNTAQDSTTVINQETDPNSDIEQVQRVVANPETAANDGSNHHSPALDDQDSTDQGSNNQNSNNEDSDHETNVKEVIVLIVEDNPTNQLVTKKIIKKMGLKSLLAEDGSVAVKIIQQMKVDLILMDCQMPVMDGFEATRQIRKLLTPQDDSLPIVAVTANTSDDDQRKCRECGMNDFLEKPISYHTLSTMIEKWLKKTADHQASTQHKVVNAQNRPG